MLDIQTKIYGDTITAQAATQGCGCGGNSIVKMATLTAQQQAIVDAIKRVEKRKNSTYKTKTRLFI